MSPHVHRRGRFVATLTASSALALGALVAGGPTPTAVAVDPVGALVGALVGDCAVAHPVEELAPGQPVDGLTVTSGTTPTSFTGEVLGVLEDGIAPDVPMVMVDLDMPEFARTGGIWQGMSGSPVYAADGRLIGAVSYVLSYGPSPIAGVTPFADMDDHLGELPALVRVDRRTASGIAARTDVTARQAQQGFREIRMPLGVSGISARRLDAVAGERGYLTRGTYAAGRSSAAADASSIVAGGNLAASLSYGDITMSGVGTATSVCQGRVVGFGHPMYLLGSTTMAMHPAQAVYVQPDSLGAPFKVANVGAPVGTITDDRTTGIAGSFGPVPESTTVSSTVASGERSRTGATEVYVPDAAAEVTFYQVLANHDRVLDGDRIGSELLTWSLAGTDERGKAFDLALTNRHVGAGGVEEAAFGLGDVVWALSGLPGVAIDSVTTTSAVSDDTATRRITRVEQRRGGAWVTVGGKVPAVVKAGKRLHLRVRLTGPDGVRSFPVKLRAPRRAPRMPVVVTVGSGGGFWFDTSFGSVKEARTVLGSVLRNDEVRVRFGTRDRVRAGSFEAMPTFRPGRSSFLRSRTSGPFDRVVRGHRSVKVVITR